MSAENITGYDRHIIIDTRHKEVIIQILYQTNGYLNMEEYHKINTGLYWQYIPKCLEEQVKYCLAQGFKVLAAHVVGVRLNKDGIVYYQYFDQVNDVQLSKLVISN